MHCISANDYDSMIELLEYKFKKFRTLFHILSKHADDIVGITQTDEGHNILRCEVTFKSAKKAEKVMDRLDVAEYDTKDIEISCTKATLNIVLIEVEAEEPSSINDESGDSDESQSV